MPCPGTPRCPAAAQKAPRGYRAAAPALGSSGLKQTGGGWGRTVPGRERERARPSAQGECLSLSVYLPDGLLACQPCWHGPATHAGRLYRSAGTGAAARSALLRPDPCGTAAPAVLRSSAAAGRAAPCRGLGGTGGLLALPRGAPCSPISQSCPLVLRTLGGISRSGGSQPPSAQRFILNS